MLHNKKFLYCLLSVEIIGVILTLLFGLSVFADNIEHIRMSWLVCQGYVPYRDFFEHHHPLIWYIFAPFMLILPHNALVVFYTSRFLSSLASIVTLYLIYRIFVRFLRAKQAFIYFLTVLFSLFPLWYSIPIFKPDTFARLFYFAGLYSFFTYLELKKTKDLAWCAIFFIIAFWFLQTVVFCIIPLALPLIYLWCKEHKIGQDIIKASIIPIIVCVGIITLLFYSGTWQRYFELNWIFNAKLFSTLFPQSETCLWYFSLIISAAFIAFIWLLKKHLANTYIKIIAFLFICELLQHIYFTAVYPHYLVNLLIFASIIIALALPYVFNNCLEWYISAYLILILPVNFITLYYWNSFSTIYNLSLINQNPNDKVLHLTYWVDNIYAPLYFYHTMGNDTRILEDYIFHRYEDFDINSFIEDNKIKFINYKKPKDKKEIITIDSFDFQRFIISPETISHYKQISPDIWQRIDD